jgi:hypothetical protein
LIEDAAGVFASGVPLVFSRQGDNDETFYY